MTVMQKSDELAEYLKTLNGNKQKMTQQEYRTIKGQALHGDVIAASRGMQKLMRRRGN